jgi:hypothetical protein
VQSRLVPLGRCILFPIVVSAVAMCQWDAAVTGRCPVDMTGYSVKPQQSHCRQRASGRVVCYQSSINHYMEEEDHRHYGLAAVRVGRSIVVDETGVRSVVADHVLSFVS